MLTDSWFKCYGQAWGNLCVPAAVAHPAKFSRKLIFRIFEHAIEEGWVKPGDTCIDCFGGVGLGALPAMLNGLHWVGVELEPRFVLLGQGGDCDGTVEIETRLVHIKAEPGCKGWFVRLRAEAKYWGKSCKVCDGGPIGEGFETKQRASAFADELATSKDRWERMAYTIHYYEDEPIAAHDEWQQFVTRPALCGRQEAHEPHHVVGNIELWNKRYAEQMPNWGSAVIVQGDSRRLGEVLARASLCCSSPPYTSDALGHSRGKATGAERAKGTPDVSYSEHPANLGNLPDTGFEAALALGSPPYSPHGIGHDAGHPRLDTTEDGRREDDGCGRRPAYGSEPGQLAQMPEGDLALAISSPPYADQPITGKRCFKNRFNERPPAKEVKAADVGYGGAPGQLAALPEGDHAAACERPVCAISSPPWESSLESKDTEFQASARPGRTIQCAAYGTEEGQLGQMPTGSHAQALEAGAVTERAQCAISSPPYEGSISAGRNDDNARQRKAERYARGEFDCKRPDVFTSQSNIGARGMFDSHYGDTEGQIGKETGSTFWAASRQILEEVYKVLAPNAHAIFVCKRFVRNKKIVDFPLQWAHLCEAVGFKWIHHHKAWLVEDRGAQHTLEGGLEERQVKRMSFFRRLHAAKYPHLEILYEDVLCFVKEPQ